MDRPDSVNYIPIQMWAVYLLGVACSVLGAEHTYTSMNSMERLVGTEERVIHFLKSAVEYEIERFEKLISYTWYFEEEHQLAALDPEGYVTNPLNAYHLMKRLTADWQDIEDLILKPVPKLSEVREDLDLPVMADMGGAAEALCRLQDTYKLNASELAKGKLRGVQYSQPMSADGAWKIGQHMYAGGDFYHATTWLNVALELHEAEVGSNPLQPTHRSLILDYAAQSTYKLGNVRKALQLTEQYLELMPNCARNKANRIGYLEELANDMNDSEADVDTVRPMSSYWNYELETAYEELCRGEVEVNHALVCRYTDCGHPYFRLRRVKMEEVNLEPRVVVFHDVIYDTEIEEIKELARPKIYRSAIWDSGKPSYVDYRISQTASLSESHKVVATVNMRASMLTNLEKMTSDALQALNYGIGGHYEVHCDFSKRHEPNDDSQPYIGDRIGSLLYYMSDVEQGGATVFPALGAAVSPRKGSALLWYNLHRDGEPDYRTLHAGCPVLIGNKWACNKWFRESMQEFRRPCLLEEDSLPFKPPAEDPDDAALGTVKASPPSTEHSNDNTEVRVDPLEHNTECGSEDHLIPT